MRARSFTGRSGWSARQTEHTFTITDNIGDAVAYYLVVNGTATDVNASTSIDQWASQIGEISIISGFVRGGTDEFRFTGPVLDARLGNGDYTAAIDGAVVSSGQDIVSVTGGDQVLAPVIPECAGDAGCPDGTVCQNGFCVEPVQQTGCVANTDCPSGFACQDGLCIEQTTNGDDGTNGGGGQQQFPWGLLAVAGAVGAVGVYAASRDE